MKSTNTIKKSALVPTAVVAGGAGFVGSHLCEALLTKGARVIALDNFQTGKRNFVQHLLNNPNFALFDCDINAGLPPEIQSVDYIFHLAGLEDYAYSKEVINLEALLTNAFGTKNLLDLARASKAKFILLSTVDVYEGRMSQIELSDYFGRSRLEENRYMLAEAKRYAEALVWEYYKKYEIDARIVRIPEVYGPRMSLEASGTLGNFLQQLLSGRDIVVSGEGVEKEYYLYITDAITGILKTMFNDNTAGNIYSLVPEDPVSVLELAYLVRSLADAGVQVKFEPALSEGYFKPGSLKVPDTFNLSDIKWEAKVSLKAGLIKSLEFFDYSTNSRSFKPAKLIEDKLEELNNRRPVKSAVAPEDTFSLSDVKQPKAHVPTPEFDNRFTQQVQPVSVPQYSSEMAPNFYGKPKSAINFAERRDPFAFLKKMSLPAVNLPQLPKVLQFDFSSPMAMRVAIVLALLVPALFIFFGVPAIDLYAKSKSGVSGLQSIAAQNLEMNSDAIKTKANTSYQNFYRAKQSLHKLKPVFSVLGQEEKYRSYDMALSSLTNFSKSVYFSAKAAKPLENLWEVVRPDTSAELNTPDFVDAQTQLSNAQKSLQAAQADIKAVDKNHIPNKYADEFKKYENVLETAQELFSATKPLYASLPDLLGSAEPKKYLVLFQNSNEIRATGGFIGSYGIVSFEKGKIKNLYIDDIYNPDGQIDLRNISVAVPTPIATLLKEQRLHLRNANWDPDFPVSANQIEDLYFKVTGEKVDGVIAVDLFFIKNLLNVTGPIFLTAYNEEITANNVYERAELHSEFDYTNGSEQKKSFLTVLGFKLLEKLFSLNREQLPSLVAQLNDSLNQRHLLLYFSNDPINEFLHKQKWDGSLVSTDGDYLYVVNSNLGGTKANYFVKNKTFYTVSALTRDGILRGNLQLEYTHTGKDMAWPGGPYTNYVRVISQKGAKLTGAKLKHDDGAEEDIYNKVITGVQGTYTTFETSFTVNPLHKAVVTLNYDLSPSLSFSKNFKDYSVYFQKQPGTSDDAMSFVFQVPFGFKVVDYSSDLNFSLDKLQTDWIAGQDKSLYVKLQ